SFVDASFFHELSAKKLDQFKLDTAHQPIFATYSIPASNGTSQPDESHLRHLTPKIALSGSSFQATAVFNNSETLSNEFVAPGTLHNLNTLADFKALDKASLLENQVRSRVWSAFQTDSVLQNPSQLADFCLISFCDLKKYVFYYWFAFGAIHSSWNLTQPVQTIDHWLQSSQSMVVAGLPKLTQSLVQSVNSLLAKTIIGFCDPSGLPNNPGWPLRNLLAYLNYKGFHSVTIICYRDLRTRDFSSGARSIVLQLKSESAFVTPATSSKTPLKITGWERNAQNKLAPKYTDLGALIDPQRLADQAVDLNLKLMKWRIAPTLNLSAIKNNRCLLLGAGTLGSYIARGLLGWGVHTITLVDNGQVSFSNPVRQPLYEFTDCLGGGKTKAPAAAHALKRIYPSANANGYDLAVPMIGHGINGLPDSPAAKRTYADYKRLVDLIRDHDTVFLLMDSRESRWLPSVIAAKLGKLVINVALGFDSFVVMRHGVCPEVITDENNDRSPHLGCYFCNDIMAPTDSLSDRTLDQMCTVTRPGIAPLASSLALEMWASVLQHPLGSQAPASDTLDEVHLSCTPHQIRGFLDDFKLLKIRTPAYKNCTVCSRAVLDSWQ
ncbi:autophagy-related protein 7, partial [Nadsonia fulvescens var. elongata DSM 6958]